MIILQIIPNLSGGGAERFCVDLCNNLVENHNVNLLTLYAPRKEDIFRQELSPNIATYSLGKEKGFDLNVFKRLYKAIKEINPDIIHTHLRSYNYLIPLLPLFKDIPIIHTVHNDAFKECSSPLIRFFRKWSFKRMQVKPVTISRESSTSFEKAYPNITYTKINNGRSTPLKSPEFFNIKEEVEGYKQSGKVKVFTTIGRLIPQKNQLMLVEAFNKLVYDNNAKSILLIIGGARDTIRSHEIQDKLRGAENEHSHIHLIKETPYVTDYLYHSDYFCLSSAFEGMPITLIEALATGCVPVCTPVGGIPEMLDELHTSLVSKSVDMNSYYQTLKVVYNLDRNETEIIKRNACELFEMKYSIKSCVANYLHLYQSLSKK